ncbi:hypothetical protein EV426DRAFT_576254 [Tirmania nivea]|nr:hypothetical protein EV426DRAFT_576254 [Tirmania nivea]
MWTRYQRMIHLEQLRYEQLKILTTRSNVLTVGDGAAHPAFQAIEQVLLEISIIQKKYMLHLNPLEVDLPLVRMLLKLSFNTRGKAKLNALIQELQGHNDSLERTLKLALSTNTMSRDNPLSSHGTRSWSSLGAKTSNPLIGAVSPTESVVSCARSPRGSGHETTESAPRTQSRLEYAFSPLRAISPSTLSQQPATSTPFPSYSSHSSHQTFPAVSASNQISYSRANSPTPSNAASGFESTRTSISRERDDNCSGPLHREYSSSSSWD